MNLSKIILAFLFSKTINAQLKSTIEKNGAIEEPAFYRVEYDDKEMFNAIEMAKQTFGEFERAIRSNNPNLKNFSLKKSYESCKGDEYLWIKSVMVYDEKNKYVGIIGNQPIYTNKVKNDDIVEINKDEISDWMYLDNNIVKGGHTLRLLRSRMNKVERKEFDNETGLIFD